ncbi:hypothetical protein E4K72_09050 [Oxalobacteraceae bacterium OM1]|nr:hypothetical protein E4K72_09050 [Oxalobacteraceae bacterium OM1]
MKKLLIALNALAVALILANIALYVVYASESVVSRWTLTLLVFALPSASFISAGVFRKSSPMAGVALAINLLFFLSLLALGAFAATGIAGAAGLLIAIFPGALILALNSFALFQGVKAKWTNSPLHADAPRQ